MYREWVYDSVLDSNRFRRWRSSRSRVHIIAVNVFIFLVILLFLTVSFFVFVIFVVYAVFLLVRVFTEIKLRLVFAAHVAKITREADQAEERRAVGSDQSETA
jgi:hypothetical protein